MTINLESLKGTYDRYPEEWANWKYLIETVERTAEEFGFRQLDAPSIERQELWTEKEEDSVTDEMYAFTDKGDSEITLIPEATPGRARLIQNRKDLKTPVKWYSTGKRWRYEDVTRGRDREFRQTDIDIFGVDSVEADAEILALAATIFDRLNLENRVKLKISDRQLVEGFLESAGIENTEEVMKVIDDEEKLTEEEFRQELEQTGISSGQIEDVISLTQMKGEFQTQINQISQELSEEFEGRIERLRELGDALEGYGVLEMCELDFSIVRGLAYYTGLVFEAFDTEGELRALFGGGRYDELVGEYGKQQVPAVGFAFGYSPAVELLKKEGRYPVKELETDAYVLTVSDTVRETARELVSDLRQEGLVVESDLASRNFGSQLAYADSINAEVTVIVGEKDLEDGNVTVKYMASGDERKVPVEEAVQEVL